MRELRAGRMTVSEAARLGGVSRQRIDQWCMAAGFDPAAARKHYLTTFYARELLRMGKRDRTKASMAPNMKAKARHPKPRKSPDKAKQRAELEANVIDFAKAGGEIKRIPPRHK
jgi:hypothetical protein